MKVTGTDGRLYTLSLVGFEPKLDEVDNRSDLHLACRALLKELFPLDKVLEEIPLPGCRYKLRLDFWLPIRKLAIEVHGRQHYEFVPYYHGNMAGFRLSKKRDSEKKEWCRVNNIELIELAFNKMDEWRANIIGTN